MRFLGKVFLVLLVLAAAFVAYGFWQGPILDAQSKAYVDAAVPAIFTRWDKQELVSRASPEFSQSMTDSDLNTFFSGMARHLGVLVRCDGATGEGRIFINQHGLRITAQYQVKAQFYTAPALIQISLIKHGDQWQIFGCHLDSRPLAP